VVVVVVVCCQNIKPFNPEFHVLYGCETWSLTLREERWLRVLRIFGPKRDEIYNRGVE
jgi:hypothetical protein